MKKAGCVMQGWMTARFERLEPRCLLSAVEPTAAEQYMLELINRARANPTAEASLDGIDLNEGLAAGTISPNAKQPLAFNPDLITAARNHSTWMIQSQTFAHNEGSVDPGSQMQSAGYPFTGSFAWGQNIAFQGTTPSVPPVNATVQKEEEDLFVDTTEPGRGHRLNILDGTYKEIGVGVETGSFQGYNSVLVTQDFAGETGNSFLTGVAYTDANRSHFYAPGEGLGGITIAAVRQSDQATFTTTTWSAGGYTLALDPGTYTVTASGTGIGTVSAGTVTIGQQNVEVDFTPALSQPVTPPITTPSDPGGTSGAGGTSPVTVQPGWVSGSVFRDRSGNGIRDRGEGPLSGWRVFVDLNNDGVWEKGEPSVLTNGKGTFKFQLAPGTYTIREVLKKGYVETTPATAAFQVTIGGGQTLAGNDFGDCVAPPKRKTHAARNLKLKEMLENRTVS